MQLVGVLTAPCTRFRHLFRAAASPTVPDGAIASTGRRAALSALIAPGSSRMNARFSKTRKAAYAWATART